MITIAIYENEYYREAVIIDIKREYTKNDNDITISR